MKRAIATVITIWDKTAAAQLTSKTYILLTQAEVHTVKLHTRLFLLCAWAINQRGKKMRIRNLQYRPWKQGLNEMSIVCLMRPVTIGIHMF